MINRDELMLHYTAINRVGNQVHITIMKAFQDKQN